MRVTPRGHYGGRSVLAKVFWRRQFDDRRVQAVTCVDLARLLEDSVGVLPISTVLLKA